LSIGKVIKSLDLRNNRISKKTIKNIHSESLIELDIGIVNIKL